MTQWEAGLPEGAALSLGQPFLATSAAPSLLMLTEFTPRKGRHGRLRGRSKSNSLKIAPASFAPAGLKGKKNFNVSFTVLETLVASWTFCPTLFTRMTSPRGRAFGEF